MENVKKLKVTMNFQKPSFKLNFSNRNNCKI